MKIYPLTLMLSVCVSGADASLPSFAEKLGSPPELSLSDALKSGSLPARNFEGLSQVTLMRSDEAPREKRYVSRMPVFTPSAGSDAKIVIHSPDPSVEYKLRVKVAEVNSVR